jgi:hypothetical protein
MNELYFIWGPPHSGQLRWMSKDYDSSSEYGIHSSLLPIQDAGDESTLSIQLKKVEMILAGPEIPNVVGHHVFCELPWSVLEDDLDLEDWIENVFRKYALSHESEWNLSFVAICPFEAQKLPELYREGLENFSRGSQSVVIVVKNETEQADPKWLQNRDLDFGRHVEVLEDFIWPLQGEIQIGAGELFDFSKEEGPFENIEIPLAPDKMKIRNLMIEIAKGTFGRFWGAEATWRSSDGQFEALSLSQNKLYSWTSDQPHLTEMTSLNGARLSASGFDVNWDLLKKSISTIQRFC